MLRPQLSGADNILVRPDQYVARRGDRVPIGGAGDVLDLVLGIAGAVLDVPRPLDQMAGV
jgi:hypothetical protein